MLGTPFFTRCPRATPTRPPSKSSPVRHGLIVRSAAAPQASRPRPAEQPSDDGADALPGGFGFLSTNDPSVLLLAVDKLGLRPHLEEQRRHLGADAEEIREPE